MKKTLRKTALAGLTALALGGCNNEMHLSGDYGGCVVNITRDDFKRLIDMRCSDYGYPSTHPNWIEAYDFEKSGVFDYIWANGSSIPENIKERSRDDPFFNYANSDSLNVIYNAVLEQNK